MAYAINISVGAVTVTIASPAVFSLTAHGLAAGDIVYLNTTGSLPTGLSVDTPYYVMSAGLTANAFQVSTTIDGSAVNTSGSQSGTHTLFKDRSADVMPETFSLDRALTNQIDILSLSVTRVDKAGAKPAMLDQIEVLEDGVSIFGGQVVEVVETISSNNTEIFALKAKDYSYDMDRFLVTNTYEDTTVAAVIEDIKDNFMPAGYTTTNVDADVPIGFITFNYEYPSKCLQQLAELINYDWYVDGNKNIFFKSKTGVDAPFELDDTSGNYHFNSLRIKGDVKNLRNTIYVRGGNYKGDLFTEEVVADGDAAVYKQGFRYSNIVVTVDSVSQTVGTDNIHDPLDYDVLYNFNEKALKWRDGNKPAADEVISVTGNPHIPILIKKSDNASQNENGIFEYKVIDKSIDSRQGARERADAELNNWKEQINEGSFSTNKAGLDVGQRIRVQSDIRELDTYYVITRIGTRIDHDPTTFIHSITLATTKTYGMIEFLQEQLMRKDKELTIDENETIEIIINLTDTATLADTLEGSDTNFQTTSPPYSWGSFDWGFAAWS
jgi:hypothetical protein